MAKGDPQNKGAAARAKYAGFEQAQFVPFSPDDLLKAKIRAWELGEDQAFLFVGNAIDAGYKISFRWDNYARCYGCWIISPPDDAHNKNLILGGRGSNPYKALKQALYAHLVLFDGIWPRPDAIRSDAEYDD
jgi:hypothetical protein